MAASSQDSDEIASINVTPLVDITLVLLIVFMVTAKLVVSQAMPMDLPKAASAGEAQSMMVVSLDAAGHISVNGKPVPKDEQLTALAKDALHANPDQRTVLSASERASHGQVMHVLDLLRLSGISKIAFGAEKTP